MKKGQILSTDLLIALILVAVAVGLVVQSLEAHYQQTASTVENAKMHQIAMDAAALEYYYGVDGRSLSTGKYLGLNTSAALIGYHVGDSFVPLADACIVSQRGTELDPINAIVCRGG